MLQVTSFVALPPWLSMHCTARVDLPLAHADQGPVCQKCEMQGAAAHVFSACMRRPISHHIAQECWAVTSLFKHRPCRLYVQFDDFYLDPSTQLKAGSCSAFFGPRFMLGSFKQTFICAFTARCAGQCAQGGSRHLVPPFRAFRHAETLEEQTCGFRAGWHPVLHAARSGDTTRPPLRQCTAR